MIVHLANKDIMERAMKMHTLLESLRAMLVSSSGAQRKIESAAYDVIKSAHDLILDTEIDLVKLHKAVACQVQSLVGAAVRSAHTSDTTEPMHEPAAGPGNKRKLPPKARAASGASGPGRRNSKAAGKAAAKAAAGPGRRASAARSISAATQVTPLATAPSRIITPPSVAAQLLGGDASKTPPTTPRGIKRTAAVESGDDFIRLPSVISDHQEEPANESGGDALDKLSAAMDKPQRKKPAAKKLVELKQAPRSSALLKGD